MAADNFARILALKAKAAAETPDYDNLSHKPTINSVTLVGDLSLSDLGINNATLVIKKNNESVGSFSANANEDVEVNIVVPTTASDVNALPFSTKYGSSITMTIDSSTYVLTTTLKDQDGNTLGVAQSVDLPLETMVVSGQYDSVNKSIILTLKNGQTITFSVADLVSGLQTEITANNKLDADLVDDTNSTNKFMTAAERADLQELKDSHVELTQAEYDALGNEKYSDDKEYFITDANIDDPTYIYGFHIDPDESDSSDCVTYLEDAVGMTPASMGSTTFNYGSWQNVFFMPKPCMVKFDGTVDYYLDPNDYSKKADGTASDYNNLAYGGNAMMEFPLIWYKFVPGVAEGEGYFYCSNHKVDDTYKCFSNMDCDGNIIDHFYMPIYNGCTYDGKMRSISGLKLSPWSTTAYSASATYAVDDVVNYQGKMYKCITAVETAEAFDPEKWEQFAFNGNTTGQEEIAQATANNTTDKTEWYIDMWCDRVLVNALLVLIAKSIDTQGKFGRGIDSGSQTAKESYITGSLDDKGLFYGSTTNGSTAVKVFGMENWWALVWHRTAGLIGSGTGPEYSYKYKMTGPYDSSGTNYIEVAGRPNSSNYIKKMMFGEYGMLPTKTGAYSTQYYKDFCYSGPGYSIVGGRSAAGALCGAFCLDTWNTFSYSSWDIAASPSCKPLRERG